MFGDHVRRLCRYCSTDFKPTGSRVYHCSGACYIRDNSKVSVTGCWIWQRSRHLSGHGQANFGGSGPSYSHRISFTAFNGPIPTGQVVRHKCDVAPCCNPSHLELGTQADNIRDRYRVRGFLDPVLLAGLQVRLARLRSRRD